MTDTFVKKSGILTEERKVNEKLTPPPNQDRFQNPAAPRNDSAVRNSLIWMEEQRTQGILEEQNRAVEYINSTPEVGPTPPNQKSKKEIKKGEEEFRLDEEAAMTVARIREAAVKKIIETRTNGKMPSGLQVAAQDAEIVNYISATDDVSILEKMPPPNTFRRQLDFSSPTDTVVRKTVVPYFQIPQNQRRVPTMYQGPAHARSPMLPVKTIMRPSSATLPNPSTVPVKSVLKQPKEETPTHIPSGTPVTEKIFVTRGPDGKIVPTRRIVIRRVLPPPPQIRKVILAPPPGLTQRIPINQSQNGFDVHQRNQGAVGNGNRELTSLANRPNCCEMTQKLVKEEPIDVKEEPMEAYKQQPYTLYDNTVNPYRAIEINYQPPQETGKSSKSISEPSALQRSTSPSRIFLGAEEPIKDFPEGPKKFSRFTQKVVRNFNNSQLAAFGKRPVANDTDELAPKPDHIINKNASAVLIEEVEPEEKEEFDEEEIQRMVELKKARIQESIRQKQAMAQKLIFNEFKICEYMQSDHFKNLIKPPDDSSTFQKIVQVPAPLAKFPEYYESMSCASPSLFNNLARIHHMQNNDVSRFLSKELAESNERKKTPVFGGPVQLTHGVLAMKRKERLKNLSCGIIAMLEVARNGVTTKVPEFIQCTSCGDIMRLCMRKCYYRGVLREYPAYRCLRKGCQTFHSIKKQFYLTIQNRISHWVAIPVPPKPSSSKKRTKFIINAVEWTAKPEEPDENIKFSKEESPEKVEKRIPKKDFVCGSSGAEISRLEDENDEKDEDEDAGETIGFRFITDDSNLDSGDHRDEDDEEEEDTDNEDSEGEVESRPITSSRYCTRSSTRVISDN